MSRAAVLVLLVTARPALAQLGEGQFGVAGSYGSGQAFGPGAGIVIGVATGRLAYVGVRWTYAAGTTTAAGPATEVRNRVQTYALDLGLQIPAGVVEVVPGISFGALRFSQRVHTTLPGGPSTMQSRVATEFLAAPGISMEVYAGRLSFIPQLQYALAGNPELPVAIQHRSVIASLRIVVTTEIGRIRH